MSKREASLLKRLHAAHCFIARLRIEAKDYGSIFSSGVHYDCAKFLKENRPVRESRMILVERDRWIDLQKFRLAELKRQRSVLSAVDNAWINDNDK